MSCTAESAIIFSSNTLRVVCISDTHNDDFRATVPSGDVLIHAGDLTDYGTLEEFQKGYEWLHSLPHQVKVLIAGNHDTGLDPNHVSFSREIEELFTSSKAKAAGIRYLTRGVHTIASLASAQSGRLFPIKVYANPYQPDFMNSKWGFTYPPYPSKAAIASWQDAPNRTDGVNLWVMHGPPEGHLDKIDIPNLKGCTAQAHAIAKARPLLCVFGHYHQSNGIERVRWAEKTGDVVEAEILTETPQGREKTVWDFCQKPITPGMETLFINAAWKTYHGPKRDGFNDRHEPLIVTIPIPVHD